MDLLQETSSVEICSWDDLTLSEPLWHFDLLTFYNLQFIFVRKTYQVHKTKWDTIIDKIIQYLMTWQVVAYRLDSGIFRTAIKLSFINSKWQTLMTVCCQEVTSVWMAIKEKITQINIARAPFTFIIRILGGIFINITYLIKIFVYNWGLLEILSLVSWHPLDLEASCLNKSWIKLNKTCWEYRRQWSLWYWFFSL